MTEQRAGPAASASRMDSSRDAVERLGGAGPVPLTPDESAQRVRRVGWWFYAEHYLLQMRRYGTVILVGAIGEPVVYLLAMGLGLGSLIDGGIASSAGVDGVSYVMFLAPALLAANALMASSVEFTYPVMSGFTWDKLYYGPQATPLQPGQIALGHVVAVLLRFLLQSVLFLVVMLAFGLVASPWAWVQVFTASLGGLAVGLPIMAYASSITQDKSQFALVQRFIIMPLFLFSGTFYPLATLPPVLQVIGWVSPQWHAAELGRVLTYGMQEPVTLTVFRVLFLMTLVAGGWFLVVRQYTRRLGWVPGRADRDAVVRTERRGARHKPLRRRPVGAETEVQNEPAGLGERSESRTADGGAHTGADRPPSGTGTAAADSPSATVPPMPAMPAMPAMPEITVRRGPLAGMYSGNARAVMERGFRALKANNWAVFASGFFEPVLYLLSFGIGLGALVGTVEGPGGPIGYGAYIAPALLAVSAMNGAIYDSTWNVFFKMQYAKTYKIMLNTSLGPLDVALGEIGMALFRGAVYSTGFLVMMGLLGHLTSPWALLMLPAAVLIAFAFASLGMAVTSYMSKFQHMDWIMIVLMPMFLLSATFFPLSVYPEPVQWFIQALPLWHGVELLRQLSVGVFTAGTVVHVLYFVVMVAGGLVFTSHRLKALFLR